MNPALRRIGLFGGSFDPVHDAHLALAQAVTAQLHLDQLRWVPTGEPWHKTRQVTAAAHREAMVRLAIADEPRWVLERCELGRAGPSYTLDTVRELQAREPAASWFLVIGQDQYEDLPTWHGWQELLRRVTLAVAARPGAPRPAPLRAFDHRDLVLPPMPVSSTDVRRRIAAGAPIDDLVPAQVASYIARHRLYAGAPFAAVQDGERDAPAPDAPASRAAPGESTSNGL